MMELLTWFPTMAHVWFEIARRLEWGYRTGDGPGPHICNVIRGMWEVGLVTTSQRDAVLAAVDVERKRQRPGSTSDSVLWVSARGSEAYRLRILFCAEQIRRCAAKGK
jgi:hypothetical protein